MEIEKTELKNTDFRGLLPFSLIFHQGITQNHIRLYALIEQYESNSKAPYFSISYFAEQCGIKARQAKYISADLKEWGFIERKKIKGRYYWNIKRQPVLIDEVQPECTPGCSENAPLECNESAPINTYKIKDLEDKKEKNIKKRKVSISKKNPKIPTPKPEKSRMSLCDLKKNNPLAIPDTMLEDYIETRKAKKAPITKTSWKRLHTELHKCLDNNINPIEAFEEMVTNGWQSIKADWLINQRKKSEASKDLNWDDESWADGLFEVVDGKVKVVDNGLLDEDSPLWK